MRRSQSTISATTGRWSWSASSPLSNSPPGARPSASTSRCRPATCPRRAPPSTARTRHSVLLRRRRSSRACRRWSRGAGNISATSSDPFKSLYTKNTKESARRARRKSLFCVPSYSSCTSWFNLYNQDHVMPELSVVVPVHNERDNIVPLLSEIVTALRGKAEFEIVYVDDASKDDSLAVLTAAKGQFPELRVLRHLSQSGQSTALRTGIRAARGAVL